MKITRTFKILIILITISFLSHLNNDPASAVTPSKKKSLKATSKIDVVTSNQTITQSTQNFTDNPNDHADIIFQNGQASGTQVARFSFPIPYSANITNPNNIEIRSYISSTQYTIPNQDIGIWSRRPDGRIWWATAVVELTNLSANEARTLTVHWGSNINRQSSFQPVTLTEVNNEINIQAGNLQYVFSKTDGSIIKEAYLNGSSVIHSNASNFIDVIDDAGMLQSSRFKSPVVTVLENGSFHKTLKFTGSLNSSASSPDYLTYTMLVTVYGGNMAGQLDYTLRTENPGNPTRNLIGDPTTNSFHKRFKNQKINIHLGFTSSNKIAQIGETLTPTSLTNETYKLYVDLKKSNIDNDVVGPTGGDATLDDVSDNAYVRVTRNGNSIYYRSDISETASGADANHSNCTTAVSDGSKTIVVAKQYCWKDSPSGITILGANNNIELNLKPERDSFYTHAQGPIYKIVNNAYTINGWDYQEATGGNNYYPADAQNYVLHSGITTRDDFSIKIIPGTLNQTANNNFGKAVQQKLVGLLNPADYRTFDAFASIPYIEDRNWNLESLPSPTARAFKLITDWSLAQTHPEKITEFDPSAPTLAWTLLESRKRGYLGGGTKGVFTYSKERLSRPWDKGKVQSAFELLASGIIGSIRTQDFNQLQSQHEFFLEETKTTWWHKNPSTQYSMDVGQWGEQGDPMSHMNNNFVSNRHMDIGGQVLGATIFNDPLAKEAITKALDKLVSLPAGSIGNNLSWWALDPNDGAGKALRNLAFGYQLTGDSLYSNVLRERLLNAKQAIDICRQYTGESLVNPEFSYQNVSVSLAQICSPNGEPSQSFIAGYMGTGFANGLDILSFVNPSDPLLPELNEFFVKFADSHYRLRFAPFLNNSQNISNYLPFVPHGIIFYDNPSHTINNDLNYCYGAPVSTFPLPNSLYNWSIKSCRPTETDPWPDIFAKAASLTNDITMRTKFMDLAEIMTRDNMLYRDSLGSVHNLNDASQDMKISMMQSSMGSANARKIAGPWGIRFLGFIKAKTLGLPPAPTTPAICPNQQPSCCGYTYCTQNGWQCDASACSSSTPTATPNNNSLPPTIYRVTLSNAGNNYSVSTGQNIIVPVYPNTPLSINLSVASGTASANDRIIAIYSNNHEPAQVLLPGTTAVNTDPTTMFEIFNHSGAELINASTVSQNYVSGPTTLNTNIAYVLDHLNSNGQHQYWIIGQMTIWY